MPFRAASIPATLRGFHQSLTTGPARAIPYGWIPGGKLAKVTEHWAGLPVLLGTRPLLACFLPVCSTLVKP